MPNSNRLVLALAAVIVTAPLAAQGGRGGNGRTQAPPVTPPAASLQTPAQAPRQGLDFQNSPLSVVLTALAEAGNIGISFNNMPNNPTSLHMGATPSKAELIENIKALAKANNVAVVETPSALILTGPAQLPSQQQMNLQEQARIAALNVQTLHVYQLKHTNAQNIAPVLTSLFQATGGGRGAVGNVGNAAANNGRGAQQNNNQQQRGAAGATGGRGGGAAGGRGGGDSPASPGYELMSADDAVSNFLSAMNNMGLTPEMQDRVVQTLTANGQTTTFTLPQQGGIQGGGAAAQNPLGLLQNLFQGPGAAGANQIQSPRILAEQISNNLLIMSNDSDWVKIQAVLAAIDLRPMQVIIEVTIAEVTRTAGLSLGMNAKAAHKSGLQADTLTLPGTSAAGAARDMILKFVGSKGAVDYNVALNALQSRGDVKVFSLPVIIAQSGAQAVLNVGQQVPVPTATQTTTTGGVPSTITTYTQVPVGTTLTVTPTVERDGYVNMIINQTDGSASVDQVSGQYITSDRSASTTVYLKDNQTTVLGGLAGKTTTKTSAGIPFLSDIPIIGHLLFGNKQETTLVSELFLFLTPHIIDDDDDIDRLRESVKDATELINKEFIPSTGRLKNDTTAVTLPPTTPPAGRGGGGGGGL